MALTFSNYYAINCWNNNPNIKRNMHVAYYVVAESATTKCAYNSQMIMNKKSCPSDYT